MENERCPTPRSGRTSCAHAARDAVRQPAARVSTWPVELAGCLSPHGASDWRRRRLDQERSPVMISMHKPEVKYLGAQDRHFNYTLGGIAHYRAEIAILTENGYTSTE